MLSRKFHDSEQCGFLECLGLRLGGCGLLVLGAGGLGGLVLVAVVMVCLPAVSESGSLLDLSHLAEDRLECSETDGDR